MAKVTGLSLEQAKAERKRLIDSGHELSKSKELGKVENYIKTLQPEKYDSKQVASAQKALSSSTQAPVIATGGDLSDFLNSYQDGLFNASNSNPETRMSEIKDMLEPDSGLPALLNRTETYLNLRDEYNVTSLEEQLTGLDSDIEAEVALLRTQRAQERAKPVAQNVISGRISEEERTAQERVDFLSRQKNTLVNQLNTSYKVIEQIMQFQTLDYNDAVQRYESEFNKNIQVYNIFREEQKDAKDTFFKMQDIARSNLQIIQNSITSGNLKFEDLPESQKTLIQKLEIQSGLPSGFTSKLKLSDKDKIVATVSNKTGTYVLKYDQNGNITTQKFDIGGGDGGDGEEKLSQFETIVKESNDAREALLERRGGDKLVSPSDYKNIRQFWVNRTGSTYEDFDDRFDGFVNRDHIQDYDLRNQGFSL